MYCVKMMTCCIFLFHSARQERRSSERFKWDEVLKQEGLGSFVEKANEKGKDTQQEGEKEGRDKGRLPWKYITSPSSEAREEKTPGLRGAALLKR